MQLHRSRPARGAAIALLAVGVLAITAACSGSSAGLGVLQSSTGSVSQAAAKEQWTVNAPGGVSSGREEPRAAQSCVGLVGTTARARPAAAKAATA